MNTILKIFRDEMAVGERDLRYALSHRHPEELFAPATSLAGQIVTDDNTSMPDQLQFQFDAQMEN